MTTALSAKFAKRQRTGPPVRAVIAWRIADDNNIGSGRFFNDDVVPFNWLQHFESIHDTQGVDWKVTGRGVSTERSMRILDGRTIRAIVEIVLPGVRGVPNPFGGEGRTDSLGFVLPVDDTSFCIFTVLRAKDTSFFDRIGSLRNRAAVDDPTHFQRFPGDWEAQGSRGPITLHSEEHLATSDRGVRMLRRLLRDQIDVVANGGDPLNVGFEPGRELVSLESGQFLS